MSTNIITTFTMPTIFELKKIVRENASVIKLKGKLLETTSDLKEFDEIHQLHINNRYQHEIDIKKLQDEVNLYKEQIVFWENKLEGAKCWMTKSNRNEKKDIKCLEFQNKVSNLIDQLKTIYIPLIENIILKSNYKI